ncbi:MAG: WbqC family protein [Flavobacteriales bacterium]|nr:WbqC family protein [Flavobacteriales bacterium]
MRQSPDRSCRIGHETSDNVPIDLRTSFHPKRPLPPEVSAAPTYTQLFADRHGFRPRMSVIDLVMNTGPEARSFLR